MTYNYSSCKIIEFLHNLPRLSFKDVLANNPQVFSLENTSYVEGLLSTALLPASLLLFTFFGFLLKCCCIKLYQTKAEYKSKNCCCSCLVLFFVAVILCGLGAAVYGSIWIRNGVVNAIMALSDMIRSLLAVGKDINRIMLFMDVIKIQSANLEKMLPLNVAANNLQEMSNSLEVMVFDFPSYTKNLAASLEKILQYIRLADEYRFMVTFSLFGFICLVCFAAIIGVGFRSKCCLLTTSFVGQLCIVCSYLYLTVFFVISIGMADLCVDPIAFINNQVNRKLPIKNDTFEFYLNCSENENLKIPYHDTVEQAKSMINDFNQDLQIIQSSILNQSAKNVVFDLSLNSNELKAELESIKHGFECKKFSDPLTKFVPSFCSEIFFGLIIKITAFLCVCLALSLLLCVAPKPWRDTENKNNTDEQLDDVIFPPPTNYRAWRDNNLRTFGNRENLNPNGNQLPRNSFTKKVSARSNGNRFEQPPPYSPSYQ